MTSCHFAQNPGNGGRPEIAAMSIANKNNEPGSRNQNGPVLQTFLPDIAGQPEEADFGEQMIDKKAANHEEKHIFSHRPVEQASSNGEQRHLADRGIAKEALRFRLPETDEVRDNKRHRTERGDDLKLIFEQRKQFEKRKENASGNAPRDDRGNVARAVS